MHGAIDLLSASTDVVAINSHGVLSRILSAIEHDAKRLLLGRFFVLA